MTPPESRPRYRQIGCCIDDSPAGESALAHARDLWSPPETVLSLVHVAPGPLVFDSVDGSQVVSARFHGGVERAITGSVTRYLVDHAPCPVLVVRHDASAQASRRPTPAEAHA